MADGSPTPGNLEELSLVYFPHSIPMPGAFGALEEGIYSSSVLVEVPGSLPFILAGAAVTNTADWVA